MTRIELGGEGGPIPTIALPDPNLDDSLPPQSFLLETGNFLKADWVGLGYTHYEVTCIGAAGGEGGFGGYGVSWPYRVVYNPATGRYDSHWHDPYVPQGLYGSQYYPARVGGGGGGGGMHRVSGLLADLPAIVPVVVGVAGGVRLPGDQMHKDPYLPTPPPPTPPSVWDPPHYNIYPPQDGFDGGASTFNGATCQASGGKGGKSAVYWDPLRPGTGYNFPGEVGGPGANGRGGQGGSGGRSAAGGGGNGADFTLIYYPGHEGQYLYIQERKVTQAKDGSWDGTIGQGGGGGLGGEYVPGWQPQYAAPATLMHSLYDPTVTEATRGALGSFSYTDTSVYGQRQDRQMFVTYNRRYNTETGELISVEQTVQPYPIVPGGGGGARISKLQGFGSHAPGFSPDGAVFVKVFKID